MFKEEREEPMFDWCMLGNAGEGRPNLGFTMDVSMYRLMQFTLRDVLIKDFDTATADRIFYEAGEIAGRAVYENLVTQKDSFDEFIHDLQELLKKMKIGILRVEKSDLEEMTFTLTVAEDLDCSGLPVCDETVCTYDEGFISGLLSAHTGGKFKVKEIDCWCSGDRVCRFDVREEHIDKITEAFYLILNGKKVSPIALPEDYPDNEIRQAVDYINRFIEEYTKASNLLSTLSKGELGFEASKGKTVILQSLKNLQGNLRHLTWKTQRIAGGDFSQKVDFMGDFSVAFNSMAQQLKDAFEKIELQNKRISEAYDIIKQEKEKSDKLLLNILPVKVADDLKRTGQTTPESFPDVTVLFSDLVGFTKLSSILDPKVLINELNDIFTAFDNVIEKNGCERMKTIGDAYLAVCGIPEANENHAENIVNSAIEILNYMKDRNRRSKMKWEIRIGIHTGKVVGGVVGVKKYIYDVFGDTINTASRMESNSEPMKINVSETTYEIIKDKYVFLPREPVDVRGKGRMKMYFVETENQRGN
jgi:class 3 adenylate cyclase/predicted hydrocarbon binding protein